MQQAYRCPTNLYYGDVVILSKRGVQQGDPCGSAGFSIGLKKLSHSLSSRLNGDEFHVILNDVKAILKFCEESGLSLNPTKCEVFIFNASPDEHAAMFEKLNALLPGIKELDESSFDLLGAPIFESAYHEHYHLV